MGRFSNLQCSSNQASCSFIINPKDIRSHIHLEFTGAPMAPQHTKGTCSKGKFTSSFSKSHLLMRSGDLGPGPPARRHSGGQVLPEGEVAAHLDHSHVHFPASAECSHLSLLLPHLWATLFWWHEHEQEINVTILWLLLSFEPTWWYQSLVKRISETTSNLGLSS